MGSKGSQTTTNTNSNQSYSAHPAIQGAAGQALAGAENAAASPFQMPVAPVAGLNANQNQAFNQYQSLQGIQTPFYNQAASLYGQAGARPDVQSFYNPMADNVTAQLKNVFGAQNSQNTASLTNAAGGVGADRIAVGQADMANQQGLAAGQTYAGLWNQAQQAAQAQQQAQMGAASGWAQLGNMSLQSGLQGTGALLGAGNQQQQQTQQELNAPYQNTLARLAYQFQTPQYLAGIAGGLAPALGGTTVGGQNQVTTPPTPSWGSQLLGLGTAGLGLAGSLGGFNGSPSWGGGSAFTGDAWGGSGANPLDGLSAGDYGPGFAGGGEVGDETSGETNITSGQNSIDPIVPYIPLNGGAGHSGPLTGAINFPSAQQPSQGGGSGGGGGGIGDFAKTAASILPFLLKKGGKVEGYDSGGYTDPPAPNMGDDIDPSRPIEGEVPWQKPWPFNEGHTEMGGNGQIVHNKPPINSILPDRIDPNSVGPVAREGSIADKILNIFRPSQANANASPPAPPAAMGQKPPIPFIGATGQRPTPQMAPPPKPMPRVSAPAPASAATEGALDSPQQSSTPDKSSGLPYPDALSRDWGQNATRSPWMALIQAGATIASTPGPIGSAIGNGILAGTQSLDSQRKELRSEQELNDKAKELAEKAKEHLDKYNKMTPYERASIAARNRELDQSEAGTTGKPGKFTGADYDRAAKFVQSMNPGVSPEQLQPLIDAEVARRRRALAGATSAAGAANVGPGDTATTAAPDPGAANRVKGKWYIGPSGQPQQWLGQ